jgi:hypothetical protein
LRRSPLVLIGLLAALCAAPAGSAEERLAGVFAAPNGTPKALATLTVERASPLAAKLDLWETSRGATIRDYDLDMTKRLHMIVISRDFSWFEHVHPQLDGRGHFTIELHVPRASGYYVFADAEPHGLGQQVFRFALRFGAPALPVEPPLAATGKTVSAGPYRVALDSLALRAGAPNALDLRITKGGAPASDLRPYLGGAAHAVFVNAQTLEYVHVHPAVTPSSTGSMDGMNMEAMGSEPMTVLPDTAKVPAAMTLHLAPIPAGTYKLWLQFRGRGGLEVASFVLNAR